MSDTRIDDLRRRVQVDPASIAFAALAEEYRRLGQFEEAIATCTAGLQRHPAYLSAHVTLGRALMGVGRYDEARQELEHVLRAAPENLAAIRGLAEIHNHQREASARAWQPVASGLQPAGAEAAQAQGEPASAPAAVSAREAAPTLAADPPPVLAVGPAAAADPAPAADPARAFDPAPAFDPVVAQLETLLAAIVEARARQSAAHA